MAFAFHIVSVSSCSRMTFFMFSYLMCHLLVTINALNEQQTVVSGACTFTTYSSESKASINIALKKLSPLLGKKYTSLDGVDCQYEIGICTGVGDAGAGIIQIMMENNQPKNTYFIGSLNDSHIVNGTDWVMLEYKSGQKYTSHCANEARRAMIMITCDPNIDDNQAQMVFLKEENDKSEQCFYLFEMKHQAICLSYSPGSLSVGSILVIVFVCVVGVYFIVGFLYTRFVLRSKGIEQIPNYEFWKDFGNLQADGCDFLCRSKLRRQSRDFGGIGDDQLEPSETMQDDHLLPM